VANGSNGSPNQNADLDYIARDMVVRTLGMKRTLEAKQMALERGQESEKHNQDGSIKVIGAFELGKKGGTWMDSKPMQVMKPGREMTPPTFIPSMRPDMGSRGLPGRLSKDQMLVTVRRLCEKLSHKQKQQLFSQFGGFSYKSNGTLDVRKFRPATMTIEYCEAMKAIGRLSKEEKQSMFKDFHFGNDDAYLQAEMNGLKHKWKGLDEEFPPPPTAGGDQNLGATTSTFRTLPADPYSARLSATRQSLATSYKTNRGLGSVAGSRPSTGAMGATGSFGGGTRNIEVIEQEGPYGAAGIDALMATRTPMATPGRGMTRRSQSQLGMTSRSKLGMSQQLGMTRSSLKTPWTSNTRRSAMAGSWGMPAVERPKGVECAPEGGDYNAMIEELL